MSTFRGLGEDRRKRAVLLALRRSGLAGTRPRGGGVDQPDPAAGPWRHGSLFAAGPGPLGAHVRDLAKRLPQELRLAGIATMAEANRFLEELFWPAQPASPARPRTPAFVAFAGTLEDILCAQEGRVVTGDNTVRYKNRTLPRPIATATTVKAQVRVHEYRPPGRLLSALPRRLAKPSTTTGSRPRTRFDATRACG